MICADAQHMMMRSSMAMFGARSEGAEIDYFSLRRLFRVENAPPPPAAAAAAPAAAAAVVIVLLRHYLRPAVARGG